MLFMHGGWVRTGTSSLQAALVAYRDDLASAGIVYPDRWRLPERDNHHGVIELLQREDEDAKPELERFLSQLGSLSDGAVLLSAESLTYWLAGDNRDALLNLVAAARETMPVTCIWTLRNIVDVASSLYLRQLLIRRQLPSPREVMRGLTDEASWVKDTFAGHRRLEGALDNTVYLKYKRDGSHSYELLRVVGVPPTVSTSFKERLNHGPRLNARLSHKGAVAMLHRDEISARAGFAIGRAELANLFYGGEFRFDEDSPCALFDDDAIEELHRHALSAARKSGFATYLEFFEDDELERSTPVDIDPDVLNDEDLSRLAVGLRQLPLKCVGHGGTVEKTGE
jgi:hypothetical protein